MSVLFRSLSEFLLLGSGDLMQGCFNVFIRVPIGVGSEVSKFALSTSPVQYIYDCSHIQLPFSFNLNSKNIGVEEFIKNVTKRNVSPLSDADLSSGISLFKTKLLRAVSTSYELMTLHYFSSSLSNFE